jgi:hypothetical protein
MVTGVQYTFDYVIIGEPYRLCGILIQYVSCTDTVNLPPLL